MQRYALTEQDLARLYGMAAIDFGSGRSYLFDTDEGRQFLLDVANDLHERIRSMNETRISDEAKEQYIADYIGEMVTDMTYKSEMVENIVDKIKRNVVGYRRSDKITMDELREIAERLDDEFLALMGGDEENPLSDALDEMIKTRKELGQEEINDPNELLNYFKERLSTWELDSNEGENFLTEWAIRNSDWPRMLEDGWYESEYEHFQIEELMDKLEDAIYFAATEPTDRDDFAKLLGVIDEVMSTSHHGGPALQYAIENDPETNEEPSPIHITQENEEGRQLRPGGMQSALENQLYAKGGAHFPAFVRSLGLLPESAEEFLEQNLRREEQNLRQEAHKRWIRDLQQGENPRVHYNRQHSRDDYYQHPKFKNPADWMQQTPSYSAEWQTGNPYELMWQNAEAIRRERASQDPNDLKGYGQSRWDERGRARRTKNWAEWVLGPEGPTLSPNLTEDITRLSSKLDQKGQHDIADKMDRFAQRQMRLPLEYDPGDYSGVARDIIPEDEIPPYIQDDPAHYGIYHVTPYYPSVLDHGLMSREQLEGKGITSRGLGGEIYAGPYLMEDPNTVATTYSAGRADMIENDLRQLAMWLQGEIPTSSIIQPIFHAIEEELGYGTDTEKLKEFYEDVFQTLNANGVDTSDISAKDDFLSPEEIGEIIDDAPIDMNDKYEIIRDIGGVVGTFLQDLYQWSDHSPSLPISGIAAPYESIKDIDPENVRAIPLQVRTDAPVHHFPGEEQLNIHPWNLALDVDDLPKHEQTLIQRTMKPVGPKEL